MAKRIPPEAFEAYHALGPGRSYEAVAAKYGVSKRAVTKRAGAERWQERIAEREQRTQAAVANKVEESIVDLRARHAKILKALAAKAIEALKLPMTSAMDGVRTLELVIKQERLLHGEVTEHTAIEEKRQEPTGPPIPRDMGAYIKRLVEVAERQGLVNARTLFVGLEKVAIASDGAGILARTPSVN